MIDLDDEELHRPDLDRHWQESFYFNWASGDGRDFGLTRLGYSWATGKADGIAVMLRDGRAEGVHASIGADTGDRGTLSAAEGLRVGGLRFTMVEPLTRWRIELDGPNGFDLTWTAFTPAVDFHEHLDGPRIQEHFEQSGTVGGTVRRDGREERFSGLGQRDKSWGLRDWNGLEGWDWIAGQFGEDLAFNATWTDIHGERIATGYVYADGTVRVVVGVEIRYSGPGDLHQPTEGLILLTDLDGETYEIRGRALGRAPLAKSGLFIEEMHTEFEIERDGERRTGFGVMEHAFHVGALGTLRRAPRLLPILLLAKKGR